ncbi:MAG TPA: polysaccharide biosynthesis tyrosine autokinase [Candidatus Angelobacter sp.]|nr:polysaccharide biosynthesis tyrosine autokinase [Candidatus Angelobacter sp.]
MEHGAPETADVVVHEEKINLRHYWHVILERRWLVFTALFSVFALCLIYLFNAQRIFQATARMQIDRESDNVLNIKDVFAVDGREQDYLQTQYKNLQSRSLIQSVAAKLKLDRDPRYARSTDVVKAVAQDITIAPIRLSRLVDVKVEHPDPKQAAAIANTLVETFIQQNLDQKMSKSLDALRWLKVEADTLERDVEQKDLALQTYRVEKKMVSLEESQNIVLQALKQAQADLDKARSDAASAQKLDEEVERLLKSGTSIDAIPQVAGNPLIQDMRKSLAEKEALLANLLKRYKDKYPDVIRVREEIASLKDSIQRESQKVREAIRAESELARAKESIMVGELKKKEQESFELSQLRIQYDVLNRQADQSKLLYNVVLQRMKETDLTSKDKAQNMRVVDAAVVPMNPVKPRVVLTLFLGIIGGLGIAIGLAFFVNYLDDSIKSQDDIETYLRLQFLGYIPNIKTNSLLERDLQAHLRPQSNAAEGFRTLRAAVALSPNSDKYRVLTVTSTIPSEGKSLVASNLAIVMAQTGLKTLLVDADLRRPSVHKVFRLQSPIGLSSYLMDKVKSVDEFIHTTEVPNLDVVCCGAVPSSPSELAGSKRMRQFLDEIRSRYDRVIFDCPPVSAVSDPLLIASLSDGAVFVAKFNKIRRDHARKTIQRIQDAGIHILGVVLNDIDFEGKDSYYYSYYYYQNRYYSSHYSPNSGKIEKEKPEELKKAG